MFCLLKRTEFGLQRLGKVLGKGNAECLRERRLAGEFERAHDTVERGTVGAEEKGSRKLRWGIAAGLAQSARVLSGAPLAALLSADDVSKTGSAPAGIAIARRERAVTGHADAGKEQVSSEKRQLVRTVG